MSAIWKLYYSVATELKLCLLLMDTKQVAVNVHSLHSTVSIESIVFQHSHYFPKCHVFGYHSINETILVQKVSSTFKKYVENMYKCLQ